MESLRDNLRQALTLTIPMMQRDMTFGMSESGDRLVRDLYDLAEALRQRTARIVKTAVLELEYRARQ